MKPKIYLVIGVPASGKSWVCDQIKHKFVYVHHDEYIGHISQPQAYVKAIMDAAKTAQKPLLIEAPFSISQIKDPLENAGFEITPVFIQENPHVVASRYAKRENKPIPKGHLTRMQTYAQRAKEWGSFQGTSDEVLKYLQQV